MSQTLESRPAKKTGDSENARRAPATAQRTTPTDPLPLQTLLYLQKFAGNAAVAEMLEATGRNRDYIPPPPAEGRVHNIPPPPGEGRVDYNPPPPGEGRVDNIPPPPGEGRVGVDAPAPANGPLGELFGQSLGGPLGGLFGRASPAEGPATASAGAAAIVGEVAGVAMPILGAVASPFAGIMGGLMGSAVAPAPPQAGQQPMTPAAAAAPGQTQAKPPGGSAVAQGKPPVAGTAPGQGKAQAPTKAAAPATTQGAVAGGATAGEAAAAGPTAAEPSSAAPPTPETDPNFQAVKGRIQQKGAQTKQHPPARAKVAEAQAAAHGPSNEVASQAGAAQVEKMAAQQPGGFDKKAFMDAVRKAIDSAAPHNLEEADDFKNSGKAAQVAGQVSGLVGQNKQQAEKGIKDTTEAPPDTSAAQPKPVTPLPDEQPGAPPAPVGAGSAMPSPKSAEDVSLAKGPTEVNASMQEADVSEQQLKESNEPEFNDALKDKQAAEEHSAQAPVAFRQQEQDILQKSRGAAGQTADQRLQAMHGDRAKVLGAVAGGKVQAKAQDEARRAEVSSKIDSIYGKTKDEVTAILNGIDPQVDATFKDGEAGARAAFESYVDTRVSAYKDDRYSGLRGKWRWVRDKFKGLPSEVNQFYADGRELYLQRMETVISTVADIVGRELTKAKGRITQGQAEITQYVHSLPNDLQKVGQEAQKNIQGKFDELVQTVEAKQDDLVNSLAQKYVESRDAVDDRIKEMKEANKGLIDKAKDAVMGVINTIRKLKDMLLNVLAKAASVIGGIIAHPIRFLGNLVDGLKQGFHNFKENIGTHLEKGLLSWLFGALGDAGLTMPEKFDLKGILSIILQVLGLTYGHIRGLAVGIVGEEVVAHLEKTVEFFQILIKEGPAGLWKWIVEKLSEFKETVMTKIKEFIQEKVIIAGIMWLLGLLNPVAAFIKACKAIYDIVKFFIERAEQVGELISSILDSIGAVVGGNLGEMASKVETALAKAIPVAIGFLASLLGLGGISDKIREIIHAIQEPIHNIISKVLGVVLKPFKWIGNKIKAGAGWAKHKLQQGVAYVKDKAKAGAAFVKGKVKGVFGKGETEQSLAVKEKAKTDVVALTKQKYQSVEQFDAALAGVYAKYKPEGLKSLAVRGVDAQDAGKPFAITAAASAEVPLVSVQYNDLFAESAEKPAGGEEEFASQGFATSAMLIVDGHPVTEIMKNDTANDKHAEDQIVGEPMWEQVLEMARRRYLRSKQATSIRLVINRTPCHGRCSPKLREALADYFDGFTNKASAKQLINFHLACTGIYEPFYKSTDPVTGKPTKEKVYFIRESGKLFRWEGGPTTDKDLEGLSEAGWTLEGLRVGEPKPYGKQLEKFLADRLEKLKHLREAG
jgi:hypothetical protein